MMHEPGFEPRSPAWKAGILAVVLFVLVNTNNNFKLFINISFNK